MKLVITGGHFTPAWAMVPILQKEFSLLFVIRKHAYEGDSSFSFEYQTVQKLGLPFRVISAGRLQRRWTFYTLPALLKFPLGFLQSFLILIGYRPDIVLSFGGYVALPVALAAFILRIPVITHEQTIRAGLANKIIAYFAKKICVTFKESLWQFPKEKTVLTGNPIRKELFFSGQKPPFPIKLGLPIIYINGGSGGSAYINEAISSILPRLLQKYIVIHQTGGSFAPKLPAKLKERYIFKNWFEVQELAWIYRHISLLLGRSGANTVYEVLTFGIPAIFIPLSWAGASEQEQNAELAEKTGLAKVLPQKTLTNKVLLSAIDEMISKKNQHHSLKAKSLIIGNARENILKVLKNVRAYEKTA